MACTDADLSGDANCKFNNFGERSFVTTVSIKTMTDELRKCCLSPEGWHLEGNGETYDIRHPEDSDKGREDGQILSRAAYIVLGVTVDGHKEILSITVGANESSKFWLGMLNDLKNRGVKDVLFFCVDGLAGFKEAIGAVYPQAQIRRCVIHMLRNSFKYVNYNDLKKFSSDFKAVYNAPNEEAALSELGTVREKWGRKYPYAIRNRENNWEDVSSFFQFSDDIRRIMYTTNIIEGLNRQYRKVTKTKSVFPNDTALEKLLYLASRNVVKKWTQRYRNWEQVLNQLTVLYGERLTEYL